MHLLGSVTDTDDIGVVAGISSGPTMPNVYSIPKVEVPVIPGLECGVLDLFVISTPPNT
jgi:hypothetical protein